MADIDKHFKNIFLFKVLCGFIAFITIFYVVISSFYNIFRKKQEDLLDITNLKYDLLSLDDAKIKMKNLEFSSKDDDENKYILTANEANKNSHGMIQMKNIKMSYSKIGSADTLFITSPSAKMQEDAQILHINNEAVIWFKDYLVKASELLIDLKSSSAESNNPIILTRGNSILKADKFVADNNNQIIRLNGNVKASIDVSENN